ncbi:MAG TPA: MTH938/NDUFAF3 family protein [Acidobacteriota bacterium]
MIIAHYSFGKIVIDSRTYTSDVIIYPGRVDGKWWRKEGHRLQPEDLTGVVEAEPEAVVIGTGNLGLMKFPAETKTYLQSRGIEVHSARTGRAVDLFNTLQAKKRTVACLHLTC